MTVCVSIRALMADVRTAGFPQVRRSGRTPGRGSFVKSRNPPFSKGRPGAAKVKWRVELPELASADPAPGAACWSKADSADSKEDQTTRANTQPWHGYAVIETRSSVLVTAVWVDSPETTPGKSLDSSAAGGPCGQPRASTGHYWDAPTCGQPEMYGFATSASVCYAILTCREMTPRGRLWGVSGQEGQKYRSPRRECAEARAGVSWDRSPLAMSRQRRPVPIRERPEMRLAVGSCNDMRRGVRSFG